MIYRFLLYRFLILLILSVVCIAGCDASTNNNLVIIQAENKAALQTPEVVGTTEDGQEVKRYKVNNPEYANGSYPREYPHYIYVVGATVTVNKMERNGKQHHNSVIIMFNGRTNTFELEESK